MVDFPEGYGFAPSHKVRIMQESFWVDIGVFSRKATGRTRVDRNRSPYTFTPIGIIRKLNNETPLRGTLYGAEDAPIEGSLQQVVTAVCTLHRMKGHMK